VRNSTLTLNIFGRYSFVSAAVMAFVGSALTLLIREEPISSRPMAVSAAA
jgi:hypothetical protein